jgi:hypothetical protein
MLIMTIEEAYAEMSGVRNLWAALKAVESEWDDIDPYTKTAYKMVKRELEKEMANGN